VPPRVTRTFAYVANYTSADISIYQVGAGGSLAPAGVVDVGAEALSVTVHPSGRFAYAVVDGGRSIFAFQVDSSTGMLSSRVAVEVGDDPSVTRFAPSGEVAYVIVDGVNVAVLAVDTATGLLSPASSEAFGTPPRDIAVDPSGKFVFVATAEGSVSSFAVGGAGGLQYVNSSTAGTGPAEIAVAPSGAFLYVVNGDGTISTHAIDADGALGAGSLLDEGRLLLRSFAIDPSGRFAYAITGTVGLGYTMSIYTIERGTGSLEFKEDLPAGTAVPYSLAIASGGQFMYVTDQVGSAVLTLDVNQGDGTLTLRPGTVTTGTEPAGIRVVNVVS
jgi:6-phosphogluconolactonase (cycloisomerase 2 family)